MRETPKLRRLVARVEFGPPSSTIRKALVATRVFLHAATEGLISYEQDTFVRVYDIGTKSVIWERNCGRDYDAAQVDLAEVSADLEALGAEEFVRKYQTRR